MVEERASREAISNEEAERRMAQKVSTGRIIDAREIAYVVAFLASPKAVTINGDAIAVGGGPGHTLLMAQHVGTNRLIGRRLAISRSRRWFSAR